MQRGVQAVKFDFTADLTGIGNQSEQDTLALASMARDDSPARSPAAASSTAYAR